MCIQVLLRAYQSFVTDKLIERYEPLEELLITKRSKSGSGVLVITVLTSPFPTVDGVKQKFSCKWNCYYCPNEPNQPRSYLRDEPAVLRANQNGFDPVLQVSLTPLPVFFDLHFHSFMIVHEHLPKTGILLIKWSFWFWAAHGHLINTAIKKRLFGTCFMLLILSSREEYRSGQGAH